MKNERRSSLTLRLPRELRDWLSAEARNNYTSQNDEIVRSIRERMQMTEGKVSKANSPSVIDRTDALTSVNPSTRY